VSLSTVEAEFITTLTACYESLTQCLSRRCVLTRTKLSLYYSTSHYIYYTSPHAFFCASRHSSIIASVPSPRAFFCASRHSSIIASVLSPHISFNAIISPLCHNEHHSEVNLLHSCQENSLASIFI